ncbi:MAG: hypothetical protein M3384_18280 [Acidobacteriota bacterium]|nr:hypothetical protein [Acidobacteriota bacterium]
MNNQEWTPPPPPPENDTIFSDGTREFYAAEIRKDATKALVFGILSLFCCPPIFGYLGYTTAQEVLVNIDIYQVEAGKKAMAQIGKVLSITGVVLWTLGVILRVFLGAAGG